MECGKFLLSLQLYIFVQSANYMIFLQQLDLVISADVNNRRILLGVVFSGEHLSSSQIKYSVIQCRIPSLGEAGT